MPTKTLENARKLQRQLESGVTGHAIPAAEAIDAQRPKAEKLALATTLHGTAASCARAFERFLAAERTVVREDAEDRSAREGRDDGAALLRQTLSRLAAAIGATYGRASVETLALSGTTPIVPDQLVTAGRRFLLATDTLPALPAPRDAWAAIDLAAARATVLAQVEALERALDATAEETRQTQAARQARDEAAEAWKREATLWAALARAALRYDGQHDLASRLLPSASTIRNVEVLDPATLDNPTPPPSDDPA